MCDYVKLCIFCGKPNKIILYCPTFRNPGWWFGTLVIFPYIGNDHPIWRTPSFFRGVGPTTNQQYSVAHDLSTQISWDHDARLALGWDLSQQILHENPYEILMSSGLRAVLGWHWANRASWPSQGPGRWLWLQRTPVGYEWNPMVFWWAI